MQLPVLLICHTLVIYWQASVYCGETPAHPQHSPSHTPTPCRKGIRLRFRNQWWETGTSLCPCMAPCSTTLHWAVYRQTKQGMFHCGSNAKRLLGRQLKWFQEEISFPLNRLNGGCVNNTCAGTKQHAGSMPPQSNQMACQGGTTIPVTAPCCTHQRTSEMGLPREEVQNLEEHCSLLQCAFNMGPTAGL